MVIVHYPDICEEERKRRLEELRAFIIELLKVDREYRKDENNA
ncbi:hypothetical protein [Thermoactinomyces sp. CICC 10521]|nr:hypothetical protein [Thermoactinomyces sp. CICC 10521]